MKLLRTITCLLLIMFFNNAEASGPVYSNVKGVFIQLDESYINKTSGDWGSIFTGLKGLGIDTAVIQWSAENNTVYFESSLDYRNKYNVLEKIIAEAENIGFNIYLGLHHEINYWTMITAPSDVLEDFFFLRTAVNEKLLKDLIRKFGHKDVLAGYYIPDEIDDLNWRSPEKIRIYNNYLKLLVERIKAHDNRRPVAISTFVRSRTSPSVFAENLFSILDKTGINILCIQDGFGENDPPEHYGHVYFEHIASLNKGKYELWGIIEAFSNIKQKEGVVTADPASKERINKQIEDAGDYFDKLFIFSLRYIKI